MTSSFKITNHNQELNIESDHLQTLAKNKNVNILATSELE